MSDFEPRVPGVPPIGYLAHARTYYEHASGGAIDLGSSGTPWVLAEELDVVPASFTDGFGPEKLRAAIAERYGRPLAQTGLARGTSGGLFTVLRALFEPGAVLLLERPVYEPLLRVAEGIGYEIVPFTRNAEAGYAFEPAAVAGLLGERRGHVLLSDPHNPTSALLEPAAIAELAQRLAPRGGFVIVDECYRDFHIPRLGVTTAASLAENVVGLSSLTKTYGLGWARIGWIFGHPALVQAAEEVGYHIAGHYGYDYAAWGRAAFARIDTLLERALRLASGKLELLADLVERHSDRLTWHRPQAGLVGFLRSRDGTPMQSLCESLHKQHGVITADGRFFGEPSGIRLGLATSLSAFEEGLKRIEQALAASANS